MNRSRCLRICQAAALLLLLCVSSSSAQPGGPGFALGAGAVYRTSPYTDVDDRTNIIPVMSLRWQRFYTRGAGFGVSLYQSRNLSIGLLSTYRFEFYRASDSDALTGMRDRDGTLEAGVAVDWNAGIATLSFEGRSDILDEHNGREYSLKLSKPYRALYISIEPYVGVNILSDDLSDYAYGVEPAEAIAGRPAYDVGEATNLTCGLSIRTGLSRNTMIMCNLEAETLDDDITDSPIVDEDVIYSCLLGMAYSF